jgi:hypothetical protein
MDPREGGWESMEWIKLALDREQWRAVAKSVVNLRVPYMVGNFFTGWVTVSFWRTLLHGVSYIAYTQATALFYVALWSCDKCSLVPSCRNLKDVFKRRKARLEQTMLGIVVCLTPARFKSRSWTWAG